MSLAPAADHTLRVLELLARQLEPVSAVTVSTALALPRSTTYRLLGALVEAGFASYLPEERRYGLGVVAFELGSAYQRQMPLRRIAHPILARLVDQVQHNGHLAVLHGRDVYYVIEERASGRPPLVTDVGVRLPATITASGQAILAHLPARQVRALFGAAADLVQRGGLGPSSPTELRRVLVDVRRRGYAFEDGLVTAGLCSVGLPVVDHTGYPVAAIALTYAGDEVDAAARGLLVAATAHAAEALRRRLRG